MVSIVKQMHALLGEYWPGAGRLFRTLDCDIAMALLHRFPTPQHLAEVSVEDVRVWLRERRCRMRSAERVVVRAAQAPAAASRISSLVVTEWVRSQVQALRALVAEIRHLDDVIETALAGHSYAHLFAELPRIGVADFGQVSCPDEGGTVRRQLAPVWNCPC